MAYYNTCSNCGAHLDPGEKCDREKKYTFDEELRELGLLKLQNYKNRLNY